MTAEIKQLVPPAHEIVEALLMRPGGGRLMLETLRDVHGVVYTEPKGGLTEDECCKLVRVIYREMRFRELH